MERDYHSPLGCAYSPGLHYYGRILLLHVAALFFFCSLSAQKVLSVEDCCALAIENNSLLKAEEKKVEQAQAKLAEVNSNFFPKVSLQGALAHVSEPIRLVDWEYLLGEWSQYVPSLLQEKSSIKLDKIWVGNAGFVQPIFMGGKIIAGHNMASSAVELASHMQEIKRNQIILAVEDTYWQLVSLRSKEMLLNQFINLLNTAARDVDLAIREGVATQADALSVKVKLNEAEQNLMKVQNGLSLLHALLAEQCGIPLDSPFSLADELDVEHLDLQTIHPPHSYSKEEISASVERRPEIRSLKTADRVFAYKENFELASALPNVALVGGYTISNPNMFRAPRYEFHGAWSVALVVRVPITDIYTSVQRRHQARAERAIKALEQDDARKMITLQMKQALLTNQEAYKQLESANSNLESAKENLRYAQIGYREGVIPLLNLTAAQTAWSQAEDNLIGAWVELKKSESKIKHLIP